MFQRPTKCFKDGKEHHYWSQIAALSTALVDETLKQNRAVIAAIQQPATPQARADDEAYGEPEDFLDEGA